MSTTTTTTTCEQSRPLLRHHPVLHKHLLTAGPLVPAHRGAADYDDDGRDAGAVVEDDHAAAASSAASSTDDQTSAPDHHHGAFRLQLRGHSHVADA